MSASQIDAFSARPQGKLTKPKLQKSGTPLWTAEKASLIDEYIHLFLLVTKHGVYVDLFAGPQRVNDTESWSVRRVLERRTEGNPAIRHYAVCDKDPAQAKRLRDLGSHHPSFRVYAGDVNEEIRTILKEAPIGSNTACFCLMDQRTFECHWATVKAVAQHKAEGRKSNCSTSWPKVGSIAPRAGRAQKNCARGGAMQTTSSSLVFDPTIEQMFFAGGSATN